MEILPEFAKNTFMNALDVISITFFLNKYKLHSFMFVMSNSSINTIIHNFNVI